MIKTKNLTPEVYYNHSRDFQFIGRLYDVIFNYLKTNEDTIYNIPSPSSINSEELELLALTLGFKSKHNYPINQLRAICGSLNDILKDKGTLSSIRNAALALLRSEGIKDTPLILKSRDNDGNLLPNIDIYLSSQLKDTNLFKDLLEYILPAGITYSLYSNASQSYAINNIGVTQDKLIATTKKSYQTSQILGYDGNVSIGGIEKGRIDNTLVTPLVDTSVVDWETQTEEGDPYEEN